MSFKKILVPIDLEKPEQKINDFLYPKVSPYEVSLHGVSNGKMWKYGMVVLKGGGISEQDMFVKIIEAKTRVESVDDLLGNLKSYLEKVKDFSIGNIIFIEKSQTGVGFNLEKYANKASIKRNFKLP